MDIEIVVTGRTDRMLRSNLSLDGKSVGELQMNREHFTRLADLLFEGDYKVISNAHGKNERVDDLG